MSSLIIMISTTDLQFDSDKTSREKGRKKDQQSDNVWRYWYTETIQYDFCNEMLFEPKQVIDTLEEPYRISLRVLGTVYQENSAEVQDEILSYLIVSNLEICQDYEKVFVILTDQSSAYTEDERRRIRCPYWDDTVMCRPILEKIIGEKVGFAVKDSQQPLDTIQAVQEYLDNLGLPEEDVTIRVPAQNLFACALALKYGAKAKYI